MNAVTKISIDLPDGLAREAASAGLLAPAAVEQMLRDRLRNDRLQKLASLRQKLADEPLPAMTQGEIDAEIANYRTSQRRAASS